MAFFRHWVLRSAITAWFVGFAAFTLCWQCDRWLPDNGLHFGDRRLARGEQFDPGTAKLRQINLAWGNAQRVGYCLNFYPDNHLTAPIQLYITWDWQRSDRQREPDETLWFAASPRSDSSWACRAAGVSVYTDHLYAGNFEDECEQRLVDLYPERLWLVAAVFTGGLAILLATKRIFRRRRMGFAVEPASSGLNGTCAPAKPAG